MAYFAYISEDNRQQTVLQHLEGATELCSRFVMPFGAEEQGMLIGLAHDIGKYSDAFQRRLQGDSRVDHATAGVYECFRRGQPAAAFCVAGYHGGLPDGGGRGIHMICPLSVAGCAEPLRESWSPIPCQRQLENVGFCRKGVSFLPDSIQVYTALTTTLFVGLKPVKP